MNATSRISYAVLTTLVGVCFTALRVYIRYFVQSRPRLKSKNFIAGDILILMAMTGSLCYFGMDLKVLSLTIQFGEDKTKWSKEEQIQYRIAAMKAGYVMLISYITTLWSIKGSFMCVYESCGVAMGKKSYRFMIFTAVYTIASCIVAYIINALSCWPLKRYWSLDLDNCTYSHYDLYTIITTVAHLSSDVMILTMGLIVVRLSTSKMRRGDIYATLFIIGLALCTIAAASVRLAVQIKLLQKMTDAAAEMIKLSTPSLDGIADLSNIDVTASTHKLMANSQKLMEKLTEWVAMASMAEINIALAAVALPSVRIWVRIRKERREGMEMELVVLGELAREHREGAVEDEGRGESWPERISLVRMLRKDFGEVREVVVVEEEGKVRR